MKLRKTNSEVKTGRSSPHGAAYIDITYHNDACRHQATVTVNVSQFM